MTTICSTVYGRKQTVALRERPKCLRECLNKRETTLFGVFFRYGILTSFPGAPFPSSNAGTPNACLYLMYLIDPSQAPGDCLNSPWLIVLCPPRTADN